MKRKMEVFAYGMADSLMLITPMAGKSTNGKRAVMATGAASDIHQQIIQAISANTIGASTEINPEGNAK